MNFQYQRSFAPFVSLALGAGFFTSEVSGQEIEFESEVFLSSNGDFSFTEVQVFDDVYYFVDVLAGGSLGAVAFSFNAEGQGGGLDERDPFDGGNDEGPGREPLGGGFSAFSVFAPWSYLFMSEAAWDEGRLIQVGGGFQSTTELGSFDSLFGQLDDHLVLFSDVLGGDSLDESNDVDGSPFPEVGEPVDPLFVRGSGLIATNGLFFDGSGNVVGGTIPEPTTTLLVGLGVGALLRRRKKS